jgi:hypothetical protein
MGNVRSYEEVKAVQEPLWANRWTNESAISKNHTSLWNTFLRKLEKHGSKRMVYFTCDFFYPNSNWQVHSFFMLQFTDLFCIQIYKLKLFLDLCYF